MHKKIGKTNWYRLCARDRHFGQQRYDEYEKQEMTIVEMWTQTHTQRTDYSSMKGTCREWNLCKNY